MSEMRRDQIRGQWVIIAPGRAERPYEFPKLPFRVVPSDRPFLTDAHDVLLDALSAGDDLGTSPERKWVHIIRGWRSHLESVRRKPGVRYSILIKNHPAHASSAEVISFPVFPKELQEKRRAALLHFEKKGSCLYCEILEEEIRARARVVEQNERFLLFVPYAAHTAYELMIFPIRHEPDFTKEGDEGLESFAKIIKSALARMERTLGRVPYHFALHNGVGGPEDAFETRCAHWHAQIFPRTFVSAGFEWGGGIFINPVRPEEAASHLRKGEPWRV